MRRLLLLRHKNEDQTCAYDRQEAPQQERRSNTQMMSDKSTTQGADGSVK
jgi:hypothetical protein